MVISISNIIGNNDVPTAGDGFTNALGRQGFLLIGDSTTAYATDSVVGPTPTAGTVYEYDGSAIVAVGASDLIDTGFGGTGQGSPWPKFGVDYYAATGKKPVFCNSHKFNSSVHYATTNVLAWTFGAGYTKGPLYTAMVTKANNTLAALSLTKFKAIFIFLPVNDIGDAVDTGAVINAAYDAVLSYLQTDFPGSPIYLITPSNIQTASNTQQAGSGDVRKHLLDLSSSLSGVKIIYNALLANSLILQSGAHWNSTQNNNVGASLSKYLVDTETDDDVRKVINMFPTTLSASHKAAYKTFITNSKANGAWARLNICIPGVASSTSNEPVELIGLTDVFKVGAARLYTVNLNSGVVFNGTTYQDTQFVQSIFTKYGSVNDFIMMAKLQSHSVADGSQGRLFYDSANIMCIKNTGTSISYRASDGTTTTVATGDLHSMLPNTWYGVGRPDASTKNLYKGSTVIHTAAVASSAASTVEVRRGETLTGVQEGFFCAQLSGFPLSAFLADFDTLLTALKS